MGAAQLPQRLCVRTAMNGLSSNGKLYFNPRLPRTRAEVMHGLSMPLAARLWRSVWNYTIASIPPWRPEQVKTCVSAGVYRRLLGWYHPTGTAISPAVTAKIPCSYSCRATAVLLSFNTRQEES